MIKKSKKINHVDTEYIVCPFCGLEKSYIHHFGATICEKCKKRFKIVEHIRYSTEKFYEV